MKIALNRAVSEQPRGKSGVITYIGDGSWDFTASQELNWRFIGIASGAQARKLQAAGARHVFPDFIQLQAASN